MDQSKLLLYLRRVINNDSIDSALVEKTAASFELLLLGKNEFLVEERGVCPHFCYLESGILQHAIMVSGEEKTTYLALKNTVTSSLNSFLSGEPSRKSIKALADCKLWVLD